MATLLGGFHPIAVSGKEIAKNAMFNAAQKLTIAAALLIAAAMLLYPPFQDWAVHLPAPIYAPLSNPPSGANGGQSIAIYWEVLTIQWAIVFTMALGLCTIFRVEKTWLPLQTAILWVGMVSIVVMLLFPPYQIGSGGPFGFPILYFKFLFKPESYAQMDQYLLILEVGVAILAILSVRVLAGKRALKHPRGSLPE